MLQNQLPFWSFFHAIEKALSYERWIDKYKLFLEAVHSNQTSYDENWNGFKTLCKALYLQDNRDEAKFDSLLDQAIARESQWLRDTLVKTAAANTVQPVDENKPGNKGTEPVTPTPKPPPVVPPVMDNNFPENGSRTDESDKKNTPGEGKKMYYLPSFDSSAFAAPGEVPAQPANFLLTDEYFPVTRRQMIKAWQFLRRKEKGGSSAEIDFPATVTQIAKDGLFLEPTYKFTVRNRKDTIMIFADYRGSMTAFHELINRLIKTALEDGGHPEAPVYYFQNFPLGVVYRQPNLTEPVLLREALLKANKNFTLAIVISDAGAARGNSNNKIMQGRLDMTNIFIDRLSESCAHTIWLNPMPQHRWANSAAAAISKQVIMQPLLEQGIYNFQDAMRTILRQHVKKSRR